MRLYAQSFDAKVYRYRDSNGLEVDAIVQMQDGHGRSLANFFMWMARNYLLF